MPVLADAPPLAVWDYLRCVPRPEWAPEQPLAREWVGMRLIERLFPRLKRLDNAVCEHSHRWESTGVSLLLSSNQRIQRCARCHGYRIAGQVDWDGEATGYLAGASCPGRPLHHWEV